MARYASLAVIILVLLAVGWLFVLLMSQFFFSLFLAALLVVVFRPLHNWMLQKCGGRHAAAAGLTTTAILLIVLVPFLVLFLRAGIEAFITATSFDKQVVVAKFAKVRGWLGLELPNQQAEEWRELAFLVTKFDPFVHNPELTLNANSLEDDGYLATLLEQTSLLAKRLDVVQVLEREPAQPGLVPLDAAEQISSKEQPAETKPLATRSDQAANSDSLASQEEQGTAAPANDAGVTKELAPEAGPVHAGPLQAGPVHAGPVAQPHQRPSGLREALAQCRSAFARKDSVGLSMSLADIRPSYLRLKQQAMGGALRAYLMEWANPSPEMVGRAQAEIINYLQSSLGPLAVGTGQLLGNLMFSLGIVAVTIFFMYADGPGMLTAVAAMLPVEEEYIRALLTEFDKTCRAVVAATLLSAFAQGLLAGVGYYFAGMDAVFLLTIVTMLMALVPFVGPAVVWAPCSLWLMFVQENRFWSGVGLFIFGATAVSTIDNLIKPYVLSGQAKLHPLPALLSVLGGVQVLGPVGIFVGPMVVALLQSLLQILNAELRRQDARKGELSSPEKPSAP